MKLGGDIDAGALCRSATLMEREEHMVSHCTPVIVGVGQFVERLNSPDYRGRSPVDLAAAAALAAITDTTVDQAIVRDMLRIVGGIRTFEDSTPAPAAFGKPDKYPLAVARRLGIDPDTAILEKAGGQSPLTLIADLAGRIATGETEAALAFGSEAISTVRHLLAEGRKLDWSEADDRQIEDHGRGTGAFMSRYILMHGLLGAAPAYSLLENARRARLGLTREDYRKQMAALFAPFTRVAAANPYSSAEISESSADELATLSERNRPITDPYPLKLISRDQVNQAAAVVLMSTGAAQRLGIPEHRRIYIHGWSLAEERDIVSRPDLGASPAAKATLDAAIAAAGRKVEEISHFDFYSCFPIAVFAAAVDGLGLSPDDPRGLTVTGGLPYFGGPGNNYSMHAFASMTERLRAAPGSFGLLGVNGGFLSKYGAAVLSTEPADWQPGEVENVKVRLDADPWPPLEQLPKGEARILTYTVTYKKGVPELGIIVGALAGGRRFLANTVDRACLDELIATDPIGRTVFVDNSAARNFFAFDRSALVAALMPPRPAFRDNYETVLLRREGSVLEITINRPDQRNSLNMTAHEELNSIFDAFEADHELWVAIVTGSGGKAFCAGADLKGIKPGVVQMPAGGWGGLTLRRHQKPVIAAVNGIAFGGGLELALACDLVVADPSAKFALTEVKRGVIAAAGGAVRLPRQIPRKIAMELLLTGREMGVEEAERRGLINRLSAPGEVMVEARRLAAEITAASPTSVRNTMALVQEADEFASGDTAAIRSGGSRAIDNVINSDDMIEGLRSFIEKRPPRWMNH